MKSKIGLVLATIYIIICIVLIVSQGLFGESFIVLLLGLPWSILFSLFEFGNVSGVLLYIFVLAPLALNAFILYKIGSLFNRKTESL